MGRVGGRGGRAVASLLVLAAVAGGCSSSDPAADPADAAAKADETPAFEAEEYSGPNIIGFYEPPDPLPDVEHGTLLSYMPLPQLEVEGGVAYRVMYMSESVPGDPTAVTGVVVVPTAEAPAEGRDLVTIAHGTSGISDDCAPSRNVGTAPEVSLAAGRFVEQGYVVALTDYEGLGTPGRHPYLVGESEGRSVLDAAAAARQVPDASVGDRYAIIGYSQGGHGALFAGQLAEAWGPDMELVGTVAGAPATELPAILAGGRSGIVSGFAMMIVAGLEASYPDADLSTLLTPDGLDALPLVDSGCVSQAIGAVITHGGELFQPDYLSAEPWADLLVENTPGHVTTDTPVLILHSAADEVVPAVLSEALFERMCDAGQVAERRVYDDGKGHVAAAVDAYLDGAEWIEGLMAGTTEDRSTCP